MSDPTRLDVYKEQYAHFRSMNDILYKIPPLFTATIGGLWFFAVSNVDKDKWIAVAIFGFTALISTAFINVMARFRLAFNAYINNLNQMDGDMKVSIQRSSLPSTILTVQIILFAAAFVSITGAIYAAHK